MGNFDVTLKEVGSDHRIGKLVADGDRVLGAGGELGRLVRAVGVGGALALGVGTGLEVRGLSVVGHVGGGEFELGLLRNGLVGRRDVGGEAVGKVLFVGLLNDGGARGQGVQNRVRYSKSDLRFRGQRLGEVNHEVLVATVKIEELAMSPRDMSRSSRSHWPIQLIPTWMTQPQ